MRFLNNAAIRPLKTTDAHVGQILQGENPYTGSIRQQVGQASQDVINAASVIPVGKGVQLAQKGLPAIKAGLVSGSKIGAGFGAAQGISTSLQDELSLPDAIKTTAINTAIGTGIGGVAGTAAPIVGAATKGTVKLAKNAQPLNEVGAVGKNIKGVGGNPYTIPKSNPTNVTKMSNKDLQYFAEKGHTSITDRYGNTRQLTPTTSPNAGKLNDLNPTGGLHVDYTPKTRATMPLGSDMTTLDKTSKVAPNDMVTVYRGAPSNQTKITAGDYITTNKDLAKSYSGNGNVIETKVPASHILDSKTSPLGEEYIYRPKPAQPVGVGKNVAPNQKPKVTLKERGFKGNIGKTLPTNVTAKEVVEAMPGYSPITNKKTLTKAANAIAENPQAEFARVVTKNQLNSADDVATGNLLLRDAIERGDSETAIQLGTKLGIDGTKLGQAVQAYATFKKTTPEGIVTYASKQAQKKGNALDKVAAEELIAKAKVIAEMPESFEKAKATRELLGQANKLGEGYGHLANEIFNVPRAAMATADFSAPLRQGAILGSRFPGQFKQAFTESAKYMFKPDYYEREMYNLTQRPTYSLMKSRGLAVNAAESLTGTEEQFLGSILEGKTAKKFGLGHVVAASDRAYSGFLTKFRADVFDKIIADTNEAGVRLDNKSLDSLTKFINSASGRGQGKVTDQVSRLQVFFSARLWKSRLDTLNPAYYARLDPLARKYALQSAASFAGITTTILGLAKLSGMADVNDDPRSADFGKIKVGNTRYDILGGLQQNIRLGAQLATGEKINSKTGEVQTLGADRGYGKPSRLDILYQFVENKENPIIGFGTKALRGTDPTGEPINIASEAGKLFVPLTAQSTYSTAKDVGSLPQSIAMNVPGTFGVGVQTYGGEKKAATTTATPTSGGEKVDSATELSNIKKDTKDGDYGLTQLSNGKYVATINGTVKTFNKLADARLASRKDKFEKSDARSKIIGDTYLYKTKDGTVKSQPKVMYESQRDTAKNKLEMDRAYESKDTGKWLAVAEKEVQNLVKKQGQYDPATEQEEIDKIQLQIENLVDKAGGYVAKGIGGSGGSGGGGSNKVLNAYQYAVSLRAGGSVPKAQTSSVRLPNIKKTSVSAKTGKPKVTMKKSKV